MGYCKLCKQSWAMRSKSEKNPMICKFCYNECVQRLETEFAYGGQTKEWFAEMYNHVYPPSIDVKLTMIRDFLEGKIEYHMKNGTKSVYSDVEINSRCMLQQLSMAAAYENVLILMNELRA